MLNLRAHTTVDTIAEEALKTDIILESLLANEAPVPDILETMSGLHDELTCAVISVCEKEMADEGFGPPPVDYCWITMGSDARREQTLRTDQDNGIIYADPADDDHESVDAYFETLAGKIVHGLDRCGFDLCTGNVMATNPTWRRSISKWSEYIEHWSRSMDPEETIVMTILLDFRPVWGNVSLARMLWYHIFRAFRNPEKMNHMLTQEDLRFDIPIGFFGQITPGKSDSDKEEINLKKGGLVHLINGARIFAVNSKISETSTLGRLRQLKELEIIPPKDAGYFIRAFETLILMRIRTNLEKIRLGQEPDNCMDPSRLTPEETKLLTNALLSVSFMQKLIRSRFTQIALNFFS